MDRSGNKSLSSWVFVYGDINSSDNVNTFHLDCSREPIQELTEQDLSLPGSDTDTSDGISVISESEIPVEIPFPEKGSTYDYFNIRNFNDPQQVEDIGSTIVENHISCTNPLCIQPIDEPNKWDWKSLLTPLNLVSVGVVVSAIFITWYTSLTMHKDVVSEDPIIMLDSSGIPNSFDEIVSKTLLCGCGEKQRNFSELNAIKQCVYDNMKKPTTNNKNHRSGTLDINDKTQKTEQVHDKLVQPDIKMKVKQEQKNSYKNQKDMKKKQNYSTGEWYDNMHNNRAALRKQYAKKNKAQWYFNRVNARQEYRHKKNYRAYSD